MANLVAVRDKVQRILAARFAVELTPDNNFTLRHESARLFVRCWEPPDGQRVIVALEVPLLFNVKPTPEVFKYVALHGDDYIFGHLSARETENGAMLAFTHSLLGDYLDDEELIQAVIGVLGVGNDIDDQLQAQFGGEKYHEDGR